MIRHDAYHMAYIFYAQGLRVFLKSQVERRVSGHGELLLHQSIQFGGTLKLSNSRFGLAQVEPVERSPQSIIRGFLSNGPVQSAM
jgi:hypothetical protein